MTFAPKIDVSFKKTNKTKKHFEVGFFRRIFLGFIGRVFYCQPWLKGTVSQDF
jgi:hypothetical protein